MKHKSERFSLVPTFEPSQTQFGTVTPQDCRPRTKTSTLAPTRAFSSVPPNSGQDPFMADFTSHNLLDVRVADQHVALT